MAEVIWTEPALQELDAIAEYIALDKPVAAIHLVEKIFNKTERLQDFLQSGRIELPNSIYREVVTPPCRIFYREDEGVCLFFTLCARSGNSALTCWLNKAQDHNQIFEF